MRILNTEQPPLPDSLAEIWHDAIADADLAGHEEQLVLIPQDLPNCGGWSSVLFARGHMVDPSIEGGIHWNDPTRMNLHRIFMSTQQRPHEEIAGLVRHELEHVRQYNFTISLDGVEYAKLLITLHDIAWQSVGDDTEQYQLIPTEVQANAAASRFVREKYGDQTIEVLTENRGPRAFFATSDEWQTLEGLLWAMRDRYWPGGLSQWPQ